MNLTQRMNLIIYIKSSKYERQLKKYGHIVFSHRKEKWVSMYINEDQLDEVLAQLDKLKYVTDVQISPYQSLKRDYSS